MSFIFILSRIKGKNSINCSNCQLSSILAITSIWIRLSMLVFLNVWYVHLVPPTKAKYYFLFCQHRPGTCWREFTVTPVCLRWSVPSSDQGAASWLLLTKSDNFSLWIRRIASVCLFHQTSLGQYFDKVSYLTQSNNANELMNEYIL